MPLPNSEDLDNIILVDRPDIQNQLNEHLAKISKRIQQLSSIHPENQQEKRMLLEQIKVLKLDLNLVKSNIKKYKKKLGIQYKSLMSQSEMLEKPIKKMANQIDKLKFKQGSHVHTSIPKTPEEKSKLDVSKLAILVGEFKEYKASLLPHRKEKKKIQQALLLIIQRINVEYNNADKKTLVLELQKSPTLFKELAHIVNGATGGKAEIDQLREHFTSQHQDKKEQRVNKHH